ncbi:unnamed protein product [Arabis nemorensis]|uniref:RRM domain-containing protein n=1 Tax=Arabis nemorensis TaxID=586526 RepID=A0A565BPD4_9BRAS|nr:unnamed protein product [Arabis nemorensis]
MGESSMKSYTDAFFKAEPEDTLESKLNLMIETMEGLANRLQRIEAKVADVRTILISEKNKKIPFKNGPGYTSSFESSDNRREAHATYTPPRSRIFGGGYDDDQTIIVKGFDTRLTEYQIKNVLRQYFRSCGEIIRVVVPTDQETGVVIGWAYII